MKKITYLLLLLSSAINAQNLVPFWSENFTNGIPSDWTNIDTSGQNCLWTWCSNSAAGNSEPGCPGIFSNPPNNQLAFGATTANTGFATLDSYFYGKLPTRHNSELVTSAINCSGKDKVWIKFQQHIVPHEQGQPREIPCNISHLRTLC